MRLSIPYSCRGKWRTGHRCARVETCCDYISFMRNMGASRVTVSLPSSHPRHTDATVVDERRLAACVPSHGAARTAAFACRIRIVSTLRPVFLLWLLTVLSFKVLLSSNEQCRRSASTVTHRFGRRRQITSTSTADSEQSLRCNPVWMIVRC
jgi:hypothetical protein